MSEETYLENIYIYNKKFIDKLSIECDQLNDHEYITEKAHELYTLMDNHYGGFDGRSPSIDLLKDLILLHCTKNPPTAQLEDDHTPTAQLEDDHPPTAQLEDDPSYTSVGPSKRQLQIERLEKLYEDRKYMFDRIVCPITPRNINKQLNYLLKIQQSQQLKQLDAETLKILLRFHCNRQKLNAKQSLKDTFPYYDFDDKSQYRKDDLPFDIHDSDDIDDSDDSDDKKKLPLTWDQLVDEQSITSSPVSIKRPIYAAEPFDETKYKPIENPETIIRDNNAAPSFILKDSDTTDNGLIIDRLIGLQYPWYYSRNFKLRHAKHMYAKPGFLNLRYDDLMKERILREIDYESGLTSIPYPSLKDKIKFLEKIVAMQHPIKLTPIINKFARKPLKLEYSQLTNIYLYAPLWLEYYGEALKQRNISRLWLKSGYIPWLTKSAVKPKFYYGRGRKTKKNKKRKTRKSKR